ncbi:MAG: hypothetical protein IID16_13420, partial [Candidatus Marinimicrobia bacterium]|nr:hypothetical protein [Candidatus Neomarinimicrobiota bacterium]
DANTDKWLITGLTITDQPQDYYDIVVTIALNSSDYIFTGTNGAGIYRSINNGDTWIGINNSLTNTDIRTIVFNSQAHLFIGTAGNGVFSSTNNGDNWSKAGNLSGHILSLSINSNNHIFAGTLDQGVFRTTTGN